MLEVEHLRKNYKLGNTVTEVLKDVSFTIEEGEFVAVMGPSGAGKTTLLNCIAKFIDFDGGEIKLNHKDISTLKEEDIAHLRNQDLGFVFQDFMLLDGLTVLENICVPKVIRKENVHLMEKKAMALMNMFGISPEAAKYPAELSGGQKQRAAVARALINDPFLILADEPTGNLDSHSSEAVIEAFLDAKQELKATIFMVTHDAYSASFCDRVVVMEDGRVHTELRNPGNQKQFLEELLHTLSEGNEAEVHETETVVY